MSENKSIIEEILEKEYNCLKEKIERKKLPKIQIDDPSQLKRGDVIYVAKHSYDDLEPQVIAIVDSYRKDGNSVLAWIVHLVIVNGVGRANAVFDKEDEIYRIEIPEEYMPQTTTRLPRNYINAFYQLCPELDIGNTIKNLESFYKSNE